MVAIRAHRTTRAGGNPPFIERAVLEAVAAASGIRDRFPNKRPQVLVVDVGAGTTDIGVFKFVVPKNGEMIVAPYRGGMRAVQTAGNDLDAALIGLAVSKLGLPEDCEPLRRFKRRLRDIIRTTKARLCEDGTVEIDVADAPRISIELAELIATPLVAHYLKSFGVAVQQALENTGASFRSLRDDSVVVFSGGGGSLPFLVDAFKAPVQLASGPVHFAVDNAVPAWVSTTVPDITAVYPQIAVATGGCSPFLPTERHIVDDTSDPGVRTMEPMYR
jgi:molecular chaperone HscA